ncbi:MAG: flavin reductase family protein [Tepidimonas sp.]|uniref:flavin reductase family protein n=1 Tax=Tepidimonas sp. TaxID=2002775 RepID=UPI004054B645
MFEPSPERFRAALGRFATGVTIVTARAADGAPVGLTANSFNSVSLEPPLVLWSLGLRSRALPVFQTATHYAVHVLAADQQALAERFACPHVDRWAGVDWCPGTGGVPLLAGAAAVFECRSRSRYPEGDHVILVGEVLRCRHDSAASPLLYHGGRFHTAHTL